MRLPMPYDVIKSGKGIIFKLIYKQYEVLKLIFAF